MPIFKPAEFFCLATGSPKPSIEWFKDDMNIPREESRVLTVPSVTPSDRGKYYCTATNTLGTAISNTSYLGIYGTFGIVDGQIHGIETDLVILGRDFVIFMWTIPVAT